MKSPAKIFIRRAIQITDGEERRIGHLPFFHGAIAHSNDREGLMQYKVDDDGNLYVFQFYIVTPNTKERNPDHDYKMCYHSMKEVLTSSIEARAIEFAHNNPTLVYGEGTEECQKVSDGVFNPYFSILCSIS